MYNCNYPWALIEWFRYGHKLDDGMIKHNYWNWFSQNIVICGCMSLRSIKLFASAVGFGELILSPLTNHNILLNFIQYIIIIVNSPLNRILIRSKFSYTVLSRLCVMLIILWINCVWEKDIKFKKVQFLIT